MDPERWQRVRAVVQEALDVAPAQRAAFLERACPDADLRKEAAALLAEHDDHPDFLEGGAGGLAAVLLREHSRLEPGHELGPYRIVRELGHGGMGVVYLARDTKLGRDVAIKVLADDVGQDETLRARLRREARAAAAVSHGGVAQVYALEEDQQGFTYIVSEFVEGQTLRQEISRGPLPVARAIDTAARIASALAAAHARGVIHRDLKPENVMRAKDGTVKVLDFGLAHLEVTDESETRLTRTGTLMGTPGYIAPEQLMGEAASPASDIYALGLILHEMLTGQHAFSGSNNSATALMARILQSAPHALPPSVVRERPGIDDVVRRCLAKRPDERYLSMAALSSSLDRLKGAAESAASDSQLTDLATRPSTGWWQVHQVVVSLLYIVMIYPAWLNRGQPLPRWGHAAVVLAVILAAAVSATVRFHLVFTARVQPAFLRAARTGARRWMQAGDVLMVVALLAAAVAALVRDRLWFAALFFTVAAGATLAAALIEPLTTEATFAEPRT